MIVDHRCFIKILLLVLLLTRVSLSVDRANFKECKDSHFCTKQHAIEPGKAVHIVDLNTLVIQTSGVKCSIKDTSTNDEFLFEVTYIQPSIFRVSIDEKDSLFPRFRIPLGDVLVADPPPARVIVSVQNDYIVLQGADGDKAVITIRPFEVRFFIHDTLVSSLNNRRLFQIERHISRPPTPTESPLKSTPDPSPVVPDVETAVNTEGSTIPPLDDSISAPVDPTDGSTETGGIHSSASTMTTTPQTEQVKPDTFWSESFRGHVDSKPRGSISVAIDIDFHGFENVYGIPEHADGFSLRNTEPQHPYRLYNLDVFEYELNNPMALYGSVPLMWAHNSNYTIGVFWHNPSETWVDVMSTQTKSGGIFSKIPSLFSKSSTEHRVDTRWMSESGIIDAFIILGRTPISAINSYSRLTGSTPLPPLFALAYHQCRWNYNDQKDVLNVDDMFDKHDIPVDVLWLDIEHTDGKRYFTWDYAKFPNPGEMVDKLNTKGRKMVTVVDPHIKQDDGWALHNDAKEKGYYVKNSQGSNFDGWCWPGSSHWPDFTRQDVRQWWAEAFLTYDPVRVDTMFTWNDMGEPSVFNGPEVTMHKDALHDNNWEHRDVHNLYGMYVHQASWEGQQLRSNRAQRSFVLTRAFFAGSQRTAAVWTGDNTANWEHLQATIPMILSLSITGITFSGADVGGFFGNPDPELLARWYQAGAFQPFFRAHAHMDTKRREPWLVPPEYMSVIRNAIRTRYALLPYWYTMFSRSEADGQPVMAPLWFHFPQDVTTFTIDHEHMVGDALLVRPVTKQGVSSVDIYLPHGVWYHIGDWSAFVGDQTIYYPVTLSSIPAFYRGGFIIPRRERVRRSSWLMRHDPYSLIVCLDPELPEAVGYIYMDDFISTSRIGAHFYQIHFKNDPPSGGQTVAGGRLRLIEAPLPNGAAQQLNSSIPKMQIERIIFLGLDTPVQRVTVLHGQSALGERRNVEFHYTEPERNGFIRRGQASQPGVLVIRQPDLQITADWELHIVTDKKLKEDL